MSQREIEWPSGSGRVAPYTLAEQKIMARLVATATGTEHSVGCVTSGRTFDLACDRCRLFNEIELLHELKVEFEVDISKEMLDSGAEPEEAVPDAAGADGSPVEPGDPLRQRAGRMHSDPTDTELAAALRNLPRKGTQRARVLARFEEIGEEGSTDYEMGRALDMFRWVAGTRREELIADGWPIHDSGTRRRTDTDNTAIVWVLSKKKHTTLL